MSNKLLITNEMAQFDSKNRDFYNSLTEEEKKQFSCYLMIRWGSVVSGGTDLEEYYVLACNKRLNKHFFTMNKHPQLQWLMATSVSPGIGKFRHEWIPMKKKESGSNNKLVKFLAKIYPTAKMSDLELQASVMTKAEARELARSMGMTDDQIKKEI